MSIQTGHWLAATILRWRPKPSLSIIWLHLPVKGGLGIHITVDVDGRVHLGPDVEWIQDFDLAVNEDRRSDFIEAVQTYWPNVTEHDLVPDYAGIGL